MNPKPTPSGAERPPTRRPTRWISWAGLGLTVAGSYLALCGKLQFADSPSLQAATPTASPIVAEDAHWKPIAPIVTQTARPPENTDPFRAAPDAERPAPDKLPEAVVAPAVAKPNPRTQKVLEAYGRNEIVPVQQGPVNPPELPPALPLEVPVVLQPSAPPPQPATEQPKGADPILPLPVPEVPKIEPELLPNPPTAVPPRELDPPVAPPEAVAPPEPRTETADPRQPRELTREERERAELLLASARAAARLAKYTEAAARFDEYLTLVPGNVDAVYEFAGILVQLGQLRKGDLLLRDRR